MRIHLVVLVVVIMFVTAQMHRHPGGLCYYSMRYFGMTGRALVFEFFPASRAFSNKIDILTMPASAPLRSFTVSHQYLPFVPVM